MAFIDVAIREFNERDYDILETAFNDDVFSFLNYVNKKGRIEELAWEDADDYLNYICLWMLRNKPELSKQYVLNSLNDVTYEDGKWYYTDSDRGELSKLFCRDRDFSQNSIKEILDGEYDNHWWYESDLDLHSSVIDDLNEKNINLLIDKLNDELSGVRIGYDNSDLLETIAEEQGHPEYVIVDKENLKTILKDSSATKEILEEAPDTEGNLRNLYSTAHSNAWESDLYEEIWGELETYFEGHGEYTTKPSTFDKNKMVQTWKIPINDLYGILENYLQENVRYNDRTLLYYGNLLNIIDEENECLRIRVPDYPSWTKIKENLNEYFGDYI